MTTKELIKRTGMKMPVLAEICGVSYDTLKNYSRGIAKTPEKVTKKLEEIASTVENL